MMYLFSPAGKARLEKLGSGHLLFAFDFDGTLAPIVKRPSLAGMRPRTRRLLERLASEATVVALSGRTLANLRPLVPANLRGWAGDHGAEVRPHPPGYAPARKKARAAVQRWRRTLEKELHGMPGVRVEKKPYSASVHYRQAPNRAAARKKILEVVARLDPAPRALDGKCVVNLLMPGLPNKGDALRALMKALGYRYALFIGDDVNDEDAFALDGPRILTVRVGRRRGTKASTYLKRQGEIDRLLRDLVGLRERPGARYGSAAEKVRKPKRY